MKTRLTISGFFFPILFLFGTAASAQPQPHQLPSVKLRDINGQPVNATHIRADSKPLLMIFWKFSDKASCDNLKTLVQTVNDSLIGEKVNVVAICSDDAVTSQQALPWIKSCELELDLYFDPNGDFRRAMGVKPPYTILFDKEMRIYCQQAGYCIGNESLVCTKIRECLEGLHNNTK